MEIAKWKQRCQDAEGELERIRHRGKAEIDREIAYRVSQMSNPVEVDGQHGTRRTYQSDVDDDSENPHSAHRSRHS